jgi:hypothetical protein
VIKNYRHWDFQKTRRSTVLSLPLQSDVFYRQSLPGLIFQNFLPEKNVCLFSLENEVVEILVAELLPGATLSRALKNIGQVFIKAVRNQGSLTEGGGSVQLTCLYELV